jgi:hypothetical protein
MKNTERWLKDRYFESYRTVTNILFTVPHLNEHHLECDSQSLSP